MSQALRGGGAPRIRARRLAQVFTRPECGQRDEKKCRSPYRHPPARCIGRLRAGNCRAKKNTDFNAKTDVQDPENAKKNVAGGE